MREDSVVFLDDHILGRYYLDFVCRMDSNLDTEVVDLVLDDDVRETFFGIDRVRGLLGR